MMNQSGYRPDKVQISKQIHLDLLRHARDIAPEEACGLLAGRDNRVSSMFIVENSLHSPVRFRMDPKQELLAILSIEDAGSELIAIYHSHPDGPPYLSQTDLEENNFPGVVQIIIHPSGDKWKCSAFIVEGIHQHEITIEIV